MKKNSIFNNGLDTKNPHKYEVDLSLEGARRGCLIGAMIGSKIPHPLATPVCVMMFCIIGGVLGKS
ncbi:hypothetical protein HGP28_11960 [Vibrio sp. SM6]|uniref:Uncharacterized protein n=1 Tax=Vibrio agarilyticus TaxID=2726741 RepID=A0A7X8TS50_9VIBR|nr:hypothetical protein [Vibrio agarilyticus]NLS13607.1 hypothetical protein [Vibrio agarilyticus]